MAEQRQEEQQQLADKEQCELKTLRCRCRKRAFTKNQRDVIRACIRHALDMVRCGGGWSQKNVVDARKVLKKLKAYE